MSIQCQNSVASKGALVPVFCGGAAVTRPATQFIDAMIGSDARMGQIAVIWLDPCKTMNSRKLVNPRSE